MKNQILIIALYGMIISSCKPAAHIQVLQPAQLTMPEHVQKIVLIDRSKPSGGWLRNLESIFSGEELNQDQQGRRRAMDAISATLSKTPRFQTITPGLELEGSRGGRTMMTPLSWWDVEKYCKQYNADALLAIEQFDSDVISTASSRSVKEKTKDGKEITKIVYDGKKNSRVNIGWRMYDPKKKQILDEYRDEERNEKTSYAQESHQKAIDYIQQSHEIIRDIASQLGTKYATRIAPIYINVARTYFKNVKGTNADRFDQAARYADAKEWYKAADIWEKIAGTRSDAEAAGKATYNLAVAAEVRGQLNMALQFAKDAYTQYGLKNAKSYIRILEQRIADQEVLERQMHEKQKS